MHVSLMVIYRAAFIEPELLHVAGLDDVSSIFNNKTVLQLLLCYLHHNLDRSRASKMLGFFLLFLYYSPTRSPQQNSKTQQKSFCLIKQKLLNNTPQIKAQQKRKLKILHQWDTYSSV